MAGLFARLADGHLPPADANVSVLPAPSGARAVVVGGTAWHVVAADVDPAWVAAQVAHDPLVAPPAPARSGVQLVQSEQWEHHPRVQRALAPAPESRSGRHRTPAPCSRSGAGCAAAGK
jgi:hypothetical protein